MTFDPHSLSPIQVIPNARLSEYTTFQLGGPCRAMFLCTHAAEATHVIKTLRAAKAPFLVMGFGSNILASDEGADIFIIRYSSPTRHIIQNGNTLSVDAATQFDALVDYAVMNRLEKMTSFSGIPGTVGGAIAGNAGAYGAQITDHLIDVTLLTVHNEIIQVPRHKIHFSYRDSEIKHSNDIILSARFQLPDGNTADMLKQRNELIMTRTKKHGHWESNPCAGSFFRNVEPTSQAGPRQSAGWFLEQSGAKDITCNGAHAYAKHANIITHDASASAQDVYDLTRLMSQKVKTHFAIDLVREVRLLGRFNNGEGNSSGFW